MEGTRLSILQLLQKNTNDTVDGLAKNIGLAPATIRRHLDILQRDRLVAFEEVRKKTGRPEYSFYLTEDGQEALPKDYDKLLNVVIKEMSGLTAEDTQGKSGPDILELVFKRLSQQVREKYERQVQGKSLKDRLEILISVMEEEDFSPEAQVSGGSLHIRLYNCPFRSVALQNKAVCSFDSNLISLMLDISISRAYCIYDGDGGCCYSAEIGTEEAEKLSA